MIDAECHRKPVLCQNSNERKSSYLMIVEVATASNNGCADGVCRRRVGTYGNLEERANAAEKPRISVVAL